MIIFSKAVYATTLLAACELFGILQLTQAQAITPQDATVVGTTTVTNTGATTINGNLTLSPGTSVTGFPPGTVVNGVISIDTPLAVQAQTDASTAYAQLTAVAPTTILATPTLGGLVLTPGVYKLATTAQLDGTLTLNTEGLVNPTFIFQVGTSLTTGSGSAIVLEGGTTDNVYWQVGSSATVGVASLFDGDIFAFTSITLDSGSSLAGGGAYAIGGAVTLDTNNVNGAAAVIPMGGAGVGSEYWNGHASALWSGANWSPTAAGTTSSTLTPLADVVFSVTGISPTNENTTLDYDAIISSLTVNDPNAVTITGAHILSIIGSGTTTGITINSGAGLTTINSNLQLAGASQVITVNNTAGLVINGVIDGTIGLTKAGNGVLTLTGANTYSGGTSLNGGTVEIGSSSVGTANAITSGPLGLGLVTVNDRTILTTDGLHNYTVANNFDLAPPLVVNVPDGTQLTMTGQITGTDGLTINAGGATTGTLILTGNGPGAGPGIGNSYSGATLLQGGTLQAGTASGTGNAFSPMSDFTLSGGSTLDLNGNSETIASLSASDTTTTATDSGRP